MKSPFVLRSKSLARLAALERKLQAFKAKDATCDNRLAEMKERMLLRKGERDVAIEQLDEAFERIVELEKICETRRVELESLNEELTEMRLSRIALLDKLSGFSLPSAHSQGEPIPVIVGVDVELDGRAVDLSNPCWDGAVEFFKRLPGLRRMMREVAGRENVPFCWFPRADPQIEVVNGDAAWALNTFSKEWDAVKSAGDEIGLHMHPWRWEGEDRGWVQDHEDDAWLLHCLNVAVEAYRAHFGVVPPSYRGGDRFLSQAVVAELDRIGVKVDLSLERIVGGKRLVESERGLGEILDGRMVPRQAFRPSDDDFRVADDRKVSGLGMMALTSYEEKSLALWLPNIFFEKALDRLLDGDEKLSHLAFVVRSNISLSGEWIHFEENVRSLARRVRQGRLMFTTVADAWLMAEKSMVK